MFAKTVGLDDVLIFFSGKNPDLGAGSDAGQVARPGRLQCSPKLSD